MSQLNPVNIHTQYFFLGSIVLLNLPSGLFFHSTKNWVHCRFDHLLNIWWRVNILKQFYIHYHLHIPSLSDPNIILSFSSPSLHGDSRARGSVVGWGTMLQAGRSRVRVPMRTLNFWDDLIIAAVLWPFNDFTLLATDSSTNKEEVKLQVCLFWTLIF
jgi:hypothetical protein